MADYGTIPAVRGHDSGHKRSRQKSASILGMIVAGSLVFSAVLVLTSNSYSAPVELSDLEDTIPAAVDELQHHVDIDEKKSWFVSPLCANTNTHSLPRSTFAFGTQTRSHIHHLIYRLLAPSPHDWNRSPHPIITLCLPVNSAMIP
jgi:hypothetical protein